MKPDVAGPAKPQSVQAQAPTPSGSPTPQPAGTGKETAPSQGMPLAVKAAGYCAGALGTAAAGATVGTQYVVMKTSELLLQAKQIYGDAKAAAVATAAGKTADAVTSADRALQNARAVKAKAQTIWSAIVDAYERGDLPDRAWSVVVDGYDNHIVRVWDEKWFAFQDWYEEKWDEICAGYEAMYNGMMGNGPGNLSPAYPGKPSGSKSPDQFQNGNLLSKADKANSSSKQSSSNLNLQLIREQQRFVNSSMPRSFAQMVPPTWLEELLQWYEAKPSECSAWLTDIWAYLRSRENDFGVSKTDYTSGLISKYRSTKLLNLKSSILWLERAQAALEKQGCPTYFTQLFETAIEQRRKIQGEWLQEGADLNALFKKPISSEAELVLYLLISSMGNSTSLGTKIYVARYRTNLAIENADKLITRLMF